MRMTYESIGSINTESALIVEVTVPQLPVEGRDEVITLRVRGSEVLAYQVYMARVELPLSVVPSGNVIEVSGSNSDAIFYWRFTPVKGSKVFGRLWLYTLRKSSEVDEAELIGGIPIELEFPWWTRGWIAAGSGNVLILGFLGLKYSTAEQNMPA